MSDQQNQKHNQGTQQQDDWEKKNPDRQQSGQHQGGQQSGQHQGGQQSGQNQGGQQKDPQWDRDRMNKDQQKKSA